MIPAAYIEKCTRLTLVEMRSPPLVRTLCMVPGPSYERELYSSEMKTHPLKWLIVLYRINFWFHCDYKYRIFPPMIARS